MIVAILRLLLVACTPATWFLVGPTFAADAPADTVPSETYLHANQLVAIDGRRQLNLLCLGTGKPAVIFDAGAGFDIITWRHVQGKVAAFTRACAFDRAGYGFSDASSRAADARNAVDDLHRLLHAAPIEVPIVYVGHSAGGLYGTYLQKVHPEDLAAAVLIDPAFTRLWEELAQGLSTKEREEIANPSWAAEARACQKLAQKGALVIPSTEQQKECVFPSWYPERVDEVLHKEISRRLSDPKVQSARVLELASVLPSKGLLSQDDLELATPVSFGDKPLIVLTHGRWYDGADSTSPGKQARALAAWAAGHDALAATSRHGRHLVMPNAGHFIQTDAPQAVVDAVKEVVEQMRADMGQHSR